MIYCSECGTQLSEKYMFCLNCGAKVSRPIMPAVCKKCGKPVPGNNRFCGNCGWDQQKDPEDEPKKEESVQEEPVRQLQPQANTNKPVRPIVCELCGGNNMVKENGFFICQNCGTKYTLEEARKIMIEGTLQVTGTVKIDDSGKIDNYLMMANTVLGFEKYREAEEYANRIIEIDSKHAEAWFIKGKATAWQSTVSKLQLRESVQCWSNTVRFAGKDKVESYRIQIRDEIVKLNNAIIDIKVSLFVEDPNMENATGLLELADLVEINRSLGVKTQIHLNEKELQGYIAASIGNAAAKAFDNANAFYGTRPQTMTSSKYIIWKNYVSNCIIVDKLAMELTRNDQTLKTIYDNIVFMQNKIISSKSFTHNGQGYVVDKVVSRAERSERKKDIDKLKVKKNEISQKILNGE